LGFHLLCFAPLFSFLGLILLIEEFDEVHAALEVLFGFPGVVARRVVVPLDEVFRTSDGLPLSEKMLTLSTILSTL
jgi:hypothetical protein